MLHQWEARIFWVKNEHSILTGEDHWWTRLPSRRKCLLWARANATCDLGYFEVLREMAAVDAIRYKECFWYSTVEKFAGIWISGLATLQRVCRVDWMWWKYSESWKSIRESNVTWIHPRAQSWRSNTMRSKVCDVSKTEILVIALSWCYFLPIHRLSLLWNQKPDLRQMRGAFCILEEKGRQQAFDHWCHTKRWRSFCPVCFINAAP